MATHAEATGGRTVIRLDEVPVDGILTVFVGTETEPRFRIKLDGTILAGNGSAAPTSVLRPAAKGSAIAPATDAASAITQVNLVITALQTAGITA